VASAGAATAAIAHRICDQKRGALTSMANTPKRDTT